jgi:hypothetical protein
MDVLGITEHAARQSDRWMFVACLVIMLAGILMLWRWFTNDRADVARRLTEITDRHIEAGQHLSQVVTNNTEALRRPGSPAAPLAAGKPRHLPARLPARETPVI